MGEYLIFIQNISKFQLLLSKQKISTLTAHNWQKSISKFSGKSKYFLQKRKVYKAGELVHLFGLFLHFSQKLQHIGNK